MYKVIDTTKHVDVEIGFATRKEAKKVRNKHNKPIEPMADTHPDAKPRFVVGRDGNHPRGETDGFDHSAVSLWS